MELVRIGKGNTPLRLHMNSCSFIAGDGTLRLKREPGMNVAQELYHVNGDG
jgi:hypothetical protein